MEPITGAGPGPSADDAPGLVAYQAGFPMDASHQQDQVGGLHKTASGALKFKIKLKGGQLSPDGTNSNMQSLADTGMSSDQPGSNGYESGLPSTSGRPKRAVKAPSRLVQELNKSGDDHDMVPCERYSGQPGSGVPGAQPFKVLVAQR